MKHSGLVLIGLVVGCGGNSNLGGEQVEGSLQTDCTTCTPGLDYAGNAILTFGRSGPQPPRSNLMYELRTTGDITLTEEGAFPTEINAGARVSTPFRFTCDKDGGSIELHDLGNSGDTTVATQAITCPLGGGMLDPMTAKVLAIVQVENGRYATRNPVLGGSLELIDSSTPDATRDALRDFMVKTVRPGAIGGCYPDPTFPTTFPTDVTAATNPSFPKQGGGAPLVFDAGGGAPIAIVIPPMDPGAKYDGVVAPQTGFKGFNAPALVPAPAAMTGIVGGTQITDGNLMGQNQPGYFLGDFPANTTTLPTMSWAAPSAPVTDIVVRITDPRIGATGNPGPLVLLCPIAATALSFTVPQATFTGFDPTVATNPNDRIRMDVFMTNLVLAPLTGGGPGEAVMALTSWVELNFFFNKM